MPLNCYEETVIPNKNLPACWQNQAALEELADFLQQNWAQRTAFYSDGQATSRQQFLQFTARQGIKTQKYVGSIVFKGKQLNIFPKVFRTEKGDNDTENLSVKHLMKNLVQWLTYCNRASYPFIRIASVPEDSEDLRELFITLYLRCVKNALDRGLFYRYEEQTENCDFVKGKADFKDYVTRKLPAGQANRFLCTYSDFLPDNQLNRILKFTCKSLLFKASKANQKAIHHILMKLSDVSDVKCTPQDCDAITLSKLHQNYAVILSMSKIFLLNKTSAYAMGNTDSFCFLFPTDLLFEGFVGGYMQSVLEETAKVRLQAGEASVFSDVVYDGQSLGKAVRMRNDILVEYPNAVFVLDTKYKMLSRFADSADVRKTVSEEITSADLYQMLTYAHARNAKDVYLLYPLFRFEAPEPCNPVGVHTAGDGTDPIRVHLVRLPFVFEENAERTKMQFTNVLASLFP